MFKLANYSKPAGLRVRLTCLIIAILTLLLIFHYLEQQQEQRLIRQQSNISNVLYSIRSSIQSTMNAVIFLNQGLSAIVATRPDIARLEIDSLAKQMLEKSKLIQRVVLIKADMAPIAWPPYHQPDAAWLKSLPSLKMEMLGSPQTQLRVHIDDSNNEHLIIYSPVYLETESGPKSHKQFWGIVAMIVDKESLFWQTGLINDSPHIELALRTIDGQSNLQYGNPDLFNQEVVTTSVTILYSGWELAGRPVNGWRHTQYRVTNFLISTFVGILAGYFMWILINYHLTIRHIAMHDALTGLPNRTLVADRAEQAIAKARRHESNFAVLHLDLDNFKPINDTYGHRTGDQILVEIANRIRDCVRGVDTVARIGGDEFLLILDDLKNERQAEIVAKKIIKAINEPYYAGAAITVTNIGASIGISIYPDHSLSFENLVKIADSAMYQAKANGKNHFYTPPFNHPPPSPA